MAAAGCVSKTPAEIVGVQCPKYRGFEFRILCDKKRLFFGTECAISPVSKPEGPSNETRRSLSAGLDARPNDRQPGAGATRDRRPHGLRNRQGLQGSRH